MASAIRYVMIIWYGGMLKEVSWKSAAGCEESGGGLYKTWGRNSGKEAIQDYSGYE